MLSSRFAGIPISSSTIDGPGVPQLLNRGEQTTRAVTGSGGRLHFGMVAGIKSERWPTSNRNPWPDCLGIRTFTFKGKNVHVAEVGKSLGVRYILEGSVRKSGARVRITAQLIDATTVNSRSNRSAQRC